MSLVINLGFALLILAYKLFIVGEPTVDHTDKYATVVFLFELLSGYGLGGSIVALFGRIGRGIYTKATDVGADLA